MDTNNNLKTANLQEFCIDDPLELQKNRTSQLSHVEQVENHLDTVTETSVQNGSQLGMINQNMDPSGHVSKQTNKEVAAVDINTLDVQKIEMNVKKCKAPRA